MLEHHAKAMKNLIPYTSSSACRDAYLRAVAVYPEVKEQTMLMKMALLCNKRGTAQIGASGAMIFLLDSLRAARLTGEFPKGEVFTVAQIVGVEKKEAGWADAQFKKQDLIAFLMHEAELLDKQCLQQCRDSKPHQPS